MRKILVEKAGGPEQLRLVEAETPKPGAGELLVEMEAAGVAFADVMQREGRYPGVSLAVTPGYDVVGRILEIGPETDGFQKGQRVAALTVTGSYAERRTLPAAHAVLAPDGADPSALTALVLNYVTAWQMIERCTALEEGDWALVHGAAGGVGTALLQLLRCKGVRAVGTASGRKRDEVERWGGVAVDYTAEDFVEVARRLTGGAGVAAAFDHIGGAHFRRSYEALAPWGVAVSYGAMGAFDRGRFSLWRGLTGLLREPRFKPLSLLLDNKAVVGFDIAGRRAARPERVNADLATLFELHAQSAIEPVVARRLPLAEVADAHRLLGDSSVSGKIVLLPE